MNQHLEQQLKQHIKQHIRFVFQNKQNKFFTTLFKPQFYLLCKTPVFYFIFFFLKKKKNNFLKFLSRGTGRPLRCLHHSGGGIGWINAFNLHSRRPTSCYAARRGSTSQIQVPYTLPQAILIPQGGK